MRRSLVISTCFALLFFVSAQPPTSPPLSPLQLLSPFQTHVVFLIRYVLNLYNEWISNSSTIRLNLFMNPPLLAQSYGIIDSIRGWASTVTEEQDNRDVALSFIRRATLYYCLLYVNELIQHGLPAIDNVGESSNNIELMNRQRIQNILSDWNWNLPDNPILLEELARFQSFAIRVRARCGVTQFRLSFRDATSIRFHENVLAGRRALRSGLYTRPIPRAPQRNRNNEVEILFRAQSFAIDLCSEFLAHQSIDLRNFMSQQARQKLLSLPQISTPQGDWNLQRTYERLLMIALIEQYFQFLLIEFGRYDCHPYHRANRRASVDAIIRGNCDNIRRMTSRLSSNAFELIGNNSGLSAFYARVRYDLPIHIGYALNDERGVTLFIALECDIAQLVQNHFNYES